MIFLDYKDIRIPKLLSKRDVYPEPDANAPALIDVRRYPLRLGYRRASQALGFKDDFLDIIVCHKCDGKYQCAEFFRAHL